MICSTSPSTSKIARAGRLLTTRQRGYPCAWACSPSICLRSASCAVWPVQIRCVPHVPVFWVRYYTRHALEASLDQLTSWCVPLICIRRARNAPAPSRDFSKLCHSVALSSRVSTPSWSRVRLRGSVWSPLCSTGCQSSMLSITALASPQASSVCSLR